MKKIGDLDIDMDALKQQASDIYDRLKDLGVDMSDLDKDTIVSAISKFFAGIIEFFKNLFSSQGGRYAASEMVRRIRRLSFRSCFRK